MNAPLTLKQKKCRMCPNKFPQFNSLHVVCSTACAIRMAEEKPKALVTLGQRRLKESRRETRQKKLAIKSLSEWHEDVKLYFNRFIRLRDGKVCISCGTQKPTIQYCAGHFRTVGAAGHLRYNEDNVHSQCNKRCNLELSGNLRAYRPALIAKIGQERFEAIENNNAVHKWTIDELKALKKHYQLKCKQLTKEQL
jgi:hypothetical protein